MYADVVRTTLRLGSTTVAYNTTIHEEATRILAETALRAGQRAIVGKMCVTLGATHGNFEPSSESSVAASERSIKQIQAMDMDRHLIHPCVQPRGGPYCPPDLMTGLGQQVKAYKVYVQGRFASFSDRFPRSRLTFVGHMCETPSDIG